MALTAIVPTRNSVNATTGFSTGSLQIPRVLGAVAISAADSLGVALTQAITPEHNPSALVSFTGDADWWWADTDLLAVTAMRKIPAMLPYVVQCTPGMTQNFYMKTAVAANIAVVMEA